MTVDDRGMYDEVHDEPGDGAIVRRLHFGRNRRARHGLLESDEPAETSLHPAETVIEVSAPDDSLVDLSSAEVGATALPEPPPRVIAPPPVFTPPETPQTPQTPPQPTAAPADDPVEPPHGMFKSFRRWWHQEALARAAQKRALATAEAIIRAQAVRFASAPVNQAPPPELQVQSVHSVLALTDEHFQSLGLRSDRLHDELAGIRRTLNELRSLTLTDAPPERVAGAAVEAVGTLEERFDSLLIALSDEFHRRSDESERRISELLTIQNAELATLLESGVARLRDAIPQGFEEIKAVIPQEMALVRATIPAEFQRIRAVIPNEMERMREHQREELDQLRAMSQKQIESLRDSSIEEIDKIRSAIPDGFTEVKALLPFELQRAVREALPDGMDGAMDRMEQITAEKVEQLLAENRTMTDGLAAEMIGAITRLRTTSEQELRAIRDGNLEAMERLGAETAEELARLRVLGMEAVREDQRGELESLREGAVREIAMLREMVAIEVTRIRQVTEDELARVASAVPGGLERVREVTASELERFREVTGEQLERVRWAIPSELERARGVGVETLESIRREVSALSRAIQGTSGDVWATTSRVTSGGAMSEAAEIGKRIEELLLGMNRTADRLAEAHHGEIERDIARR
jgi:hypothetical protein